MTLREILRIIFESHNSGLYLITEKFVITPSVQGEEDVFFDLTCTESAVNHGVGTVEVLSRDQDPPRVIFPIFARSMMRSTTAPYLFIVDSLATSLISTGGIMSRRSGE